jgi:Ti-type conjugative transfer relaxase TraA
MAVICMRIGWPPGTAEIAGVPPVVLRAFSTRRIEIEEQLAITGATSPAAAEKAALATRRVKREVDASTLFERWHATASSLGFGPDALRQVLGHAAPLELTGEHAQLIDAHLAGPHGLTEKASAFGRRDVVRAIANLGPTGMTAHAVEVHADRFLQRPDIIPLATTGLSRRYSTVELVAIERHTVDVAVARQHDGAGACPRSRVTAILRQYPSLADEQRLLVRQLTTSGNGVDVVVAAAGTGKTYAMHVAREVWQRNGYWVHGVALAGRAAAELEHTARIPSSTIASYHKRIAEKPLTARDVIVVDEAGMVGTRALAPILHAAARSGAKVVLVGDYHQLPEIDAGGLLRGLAARIEPIELEENRRQREPWERAALLELRNGDVGQALTAYLEHGRIHIAPDATAAKVAVVEAWLETSGRGERSVMLAALHDDVGDLNRLARQRLVDVGQLKGPAVVALDRVFQVGDQIVAARNDYKIGIRNGHTGTVIAVHERGRALTVRLETGEQRLIPEKYIDARQLAHGYAITIHKAQGLTIDHAHVLATTAGIDRELGYVALSRGRVSNHVHIIEPTRRDGAHRLEVEPAQAIDALGEQLRRERVRSLAIDEA